MPQIMLCKGNLTHSGQGHVSLISKILSSVSQRKIIKVQFRLKRIYYNSLNSLKSETVFLTTKIFWCKLKLTNKSSIWMEKS